MSTSINIDYFFRNPLSFPWDFMDMTIPKIGSTHSYLCSILAPYVPYSEKEFFKNRPSLKELRRFSQVYGGFSTSIVNYCDTRKDDPSSVEDQVREYLSRNSEFRKAFQEKIDRYHRQGLISVPDNARWK
jgi:hypothetical protein